MLSLREWWLACGKAGPLSCRRHSVLADQALTEFSTGVLGGFNRSLQHLNRRGVPAVERHGERYLETPTAAPRFSPDQRLALFTRAVEPTQQRELKHKGAAKGDGSYSAELIGYVEIVGSGGG